MRLFAAILASVLVAACASTATGGPAAPACDGVELIVAASDYASSVVCGAPTCELGPRTSGVDLGKDPQLATSGQRAFYIARDNELIFELDPACGTATARYSVHEERTDKPSNPHDVAVAPDGALWVVLYNRPEIVVLREGKVAEKIPLGPYDPDGNPQADAIRIVEVNGVAKAFVTLERLDDADLLRSHKPSQMLRIDVATRAVEALTELAGRNPFNPMAEQDGALLFAEPGNFDDAAEPLAGIERFDTRTSTTRLVVGERELGGSVAEVAVTAGCGAAIVAGPTPNVNPTSLVTFDPVTGRILTTAAAPILGPTPGYDLQGLAWRGDTLYVGDRRANGAGYPIHVFRREPGTCTLVATGRSIDVPQRPVTLRAAR